MFVSKISLWGAAIVACIVLVAMMALAFFDKQMLRRMLVIFGATVAQMTVVVAVVWTVVPMLYAGMLLGGVSAFEGLLVTLLLIATSFVANILAGVVALGMARKQ